MGSERISRIAAATHPAGTASPDTDDASATQKKKPA
jgi:hypothetical protein